MVKSRDIQVKLDCVKNILNDDDIIKRYGIYVKRDRDVIHPKIQEIIYSRIAVCITTDVILKIATNVFEDFKSLVDEHAILRGVIFILPYNTTIPLAPGDYLARKILADGSGICFIDSINTILDFSGENKNKKDFYGCSCFVGGILYTKDVLNDCPLGDKYDKVIDYANDFITGYRLIKHDHSIYKLTQTNLPDHISYHDVTMSTNGKINLSKRKVFQASHFNDLLDLQNKLINPDSSVLKVFAEYCEKLPLHGDIRYSLDLMLDSLNAFCLGDYVRAVLLSDLFMEFSLKIVYKSFPKYKGTPFPSDIFKVKDKDNKSLISKICLELKLDKGDSAISKWLKYSRSLRNNLVHNLGYDELNVYSAQKAVKYNLELVEKVVDKLPVRDGSPIRLLGLSGRTYRHLFEE